MNERRKFLVQSVAALGAVGLAIRAPAAEGAAAAVPSEGFKHYINQSFTVYDARTATRTRMTLVAVRPVPSGQKLDQFSLIFRARPGRTLGEGRYRFVGGPARRSELYIAPIPGGGPGTYYRADFSLLV